MKVTLLCAAFTCPDANFVASADSDANVLLQMHNAIPRHHQQRERGSQLLQTVQTLVRKVQAKEDPEGCAVASDAARTAVEEALPAIAKQHTRLQNEVNIAASSIEACASREVDGLAATTQQGEALGRAREEHRACQRTAHELQDGLAVCQQLEDLRQSMGSQGCPSLPTDGDAWIASMQQSRNQIDAALRQAVPLQESCNRAREALASQRAECTAAQRRFEEGYCAHRASCASLQLCRSGAEEKYAEIQEEFRASLESLRSEYQVLKHIECLLGHADEALAEGTIVDAESAVACSEPADTSELVIDFPESSTLTACEPTILDRAPCDAAFFAAEYGDLPQLEAIQAVCMACPFAAAPAPAPALPPLPMPHLPPHEEPPPPPPMPHLPPHEEPPPPPPQWTMVLQYGDSPYTPTVSAVGTLNENQRQFAKLSDHAINALPSGGEAAYDYYQLTSDSPVSGIDTIFVRVTGAYNDLSSSLGFTSFETCTAASFDDCTWENRQHDAQVTLDSGNNPNDCERWFTGHSNILCFAQRNQRNAGRCWSTGRACSHATRANVKMFKKTA